METKKNTAGSIPVQAGMPAPTVKQLAAQLDSDEKWTIAEQNAFAPFLAQFPNECSQGILSLGSAWKHGIAYAQSLAAAPQQHAQAAEIVQVLLYMSGNGLITWQGTGNDEDDAWNSDEEYRATLDAVRKGLAASQHAQAALSDSEITDVYRDTFNYTDDMIMQSSMLRFARAIIKASQPPAAAPSAPKRLTPKEVSEQIARDAIDGAILKGRMDIDPPPTPDHWLNEYWQIGRQLAEYGKTGVDNVNPPEDAAAPAIQQEGAAPVATMQKVSKTGPQRFAIHFEDGFKPVDGQKLYAAPAPVQPAPTSDTALYFGYSDEAAAIEAAKRLGMLGKVLNEAGAQGLAYAFLKLRKPASERDAALLGTIGNLKVWASTTSTSAPTQYLVDRAEVIAAISLQ